MVLTHNSPRSEINPPIDSTKALNLSQDNPDDMQSFIQFSFKKYISSKLSLHSEILIKDSGFKMVNELLSLVGS